MIIAGWPDGIKDVPKAVCVHTMGNVIHSLEKDGFIQHGETIIIRSIRDTWVHQSASTGWQDSVFTTSPASIMTSNNSLKHADLLEISTLETKVTTEANTTT